MATGSPRRSEVGLCDPQRLCEAYAARIVPHGGQQVGNPRAHVAQVSRSVNSDTAVAACRQITIRQVAVSEVTYYHVELPRHEVIMAEGLPVESLLDVGDRGKFANGGSLVELHPDFALRTWEASACAPLVALRLCVQ